MRSSGCNACALAQFCSNSIRWSRHHCRTSAAAQGEDIVLVNPPRRVIHQGLRLQANQVLGADYTQTAQGGVAFHGSSQQLPGLGPVGINQIQTFIAAYVISGIFAAVAALIAKFGQHRVQMILICGIHQEIHIAGGTHNFMSGQRYAAVQCGRRIESFKGSDSLLDLFGKPGYAGYMFLRYSPPTS